MELKLNDNDIRKIIAEKFSIDKDDICFYSHEEIDENTFGKEYKITKIEAYINKEDY